ncbi:helix-turn-helix transcriptional regulator [Chryseobacterium sp. CT-SW4]|uniref:helix-turn-helix transcriptional regulator n=1 Tax=Chryseobacterium sp. SW-1 TaxID=3157343 RepID=UPI003B01BF77
MIYRFFYKLINNEAEKISDDYESSYLRLINRYLFFLFFLFLFYSIFIISFFGDIFISIFLIIITFFWLVLMAAKGKTTRMQTVLKKLVVAIFILLTFIVSFFHIYSFKSVGVEYFYYSLLFAIPFFFNYKEETFSILLIAFVITLNFIGCLYFDFDFLPRSPYLQEKDHNTVRLFNILFSVSTFLIDIAFIAQKDRLIYGLIEDKKIKDTTIEDLTKTKNDLMKQQLLTNKLTEENIDEIFQLAESNSPLFYDKFQIYFSDFVPKLLKINPNLIASELHYCALMKLNFDTKKIAKSTNNSIRAVESKKYRIRKKLDIPSEININSFMLNL